MSVLQDIKIIKMKFETLLSRYQHLGYTPKGLEEYLELEGIIDWLYKTHDIYIGLMHHNHITVRSYSRVLPDQKMDRFVGFHVWNVSTENDNNKFYDDKYFDNPFDAKFNTVKVLYRALKFHRY